MNKTLEQYLTWFKAHEKFLIIAGLCFVAVHFFNRGYDYLLKHDETQAQIAHDKVVADDQRNQELQKQLAALQQRFDDLVTQTNQQIAERTRQTAQQKQKNDASAPSDVALRTEQLLNLPIGSVSVDSDKGVVFTTAAAHQNVNALEDLQQARQDLAAVQNELNGPNGCTQVLDSQKKTIAGLQTELTDEKKSHSDDVATEKLKARKSWLRGFKWGVVVGITGYEAVRVLLLHKP